MGFPKTLRFCPVMKDAFMNCSHDSMNWDKSVQPVQKKMLDAFMEKYNLQDQDWRKQMKK